MDQEELDKREKIEEVAEKVKLLFGFCATLIEDLPLMRESLEEIKEKEGFTQSAAPLIMAFGIDQEKSNFEWSMKRVRLEAMIELLEILEKTEEERSKIEKTSEDKKMLMNYLGVK